MYTIANQFNIKTNRVPVSLCQSCDRRARDVRMCFTPERDSLQKWLQNYYVETVCYAERQNSVQSTNV